MRPAPAKRTGPRIKRSDVEDARRRIAGHIRTTPVMKLDQQLVEHGYVKLEMFQHTGTFKARGAFNRILRAHEDGQLDPAVGIVVASGGNAGLANAYAAAKLGVPATVYVPETAPPVKVARLQRYGARVVQTGTDYATAYDAAQQETARTGALYCHAYDQPDIAAGAGTLALELGDQIDGPIDTVVVAVGGGGLMAGVATALDGTARVVGVEPEGAAALRAALDNNTPTDVTISSVAGDSLGARRLGDIAFETTTRTPIRSIVVTDDAITAARSLLWDQYRLVVEHGAATALAALTSGAYQPHPDENVVIVLCGANTNLNDL
nr:threonine/serine dehydratase [Microlunatus sagamiharensis]